MIAYYGVLRHCETLESTLLQYIFIGSLWLKVKKHASLRNSKVISSFLRLNLVYECFIVAKHMKWNIFFLMLKE